MTLNFTNNLSPDREAGLAAAATAAGQSEADFFEAEILALLDRWDMDRRRKVAYGLAADVINQPKAVRDALAVKVKAAMTGR